MKRVVHGCSTNLIFIAKAIYNEFSYQPGIMGYPTKVQRIKRKKSEQLYINFPAAVAKALELKQGEVVEWVIQDGKCLVLLRVENSEKGIY